MNTSSPVASAFRISRDRHLLSALRTARSRVGEAQTVVIEGQLKRVTGLTLEAVGCQARLGSRVNVLNADGGAVEAEVVGFSGERTYLMPIGDLRGVQANARVVPQAKAPTVPVGPGLLGRVLDGEGRPLDDLAA